MIDKKEFFELVQNVVASVRRRDLALAADSLELLHSKCEIDKCRTALMDIEETRSNWDELLDSLEAKYRELKVSVTNVASFGSKWEFDELLQLISDRISLTVVSEILSSNGRPAEFNDELDNRLARIAKSKNNRQVFLHAMSKVSEGKKVDNYLPKYQSLPFDIDSDE